MPVLRFSILYTLFCVLRLSSAAVVEHNFTIGHFVASPDGTPVTVLGINNQVPSPSIVVNQGDTLVVNLLNNDPVHSHSLHWHGLTQKGSPEMDGVVGVTQCALPPWKRMTYRFVVNDDPGTYWYHGHSGLTKVGTRGIAGMLIVKPKAENHDPHKDLYVEEKELFLQDWSHESPADSYMKTLGGLHPPVTQSATAHNVAMFPWISGLMNGRGTKQKHLSIDSIDDRYSVINIGVPFKNEQIRHATLDQLTTTGTRLRIVNGGEIFALKVSVDRHRLLIIATDGTDTEPLEVDSVILHVGERYDAVLIPRDDEYFDDDDGRDDDNGNYWIRATTLEMDDGAQIQMNNEVRGILRYTGAPEELPRTIPYSSKAEVVLNCFDWLSTPSLDKDSKCLPVTALRTHSSLASYYDPIVNNDPDQTHEVAFEHSRTSKYFGHFTRIRSNVHDNELPSRESHREGEYTQFVLPSMPAYAEDGAKAEDVNHDHTLHLDITHGNGVQIIWNHQSRTAHPIHIHGYKFVVAATHEANVLEHCSIVDCPDQRDWFSWPIHKGVVDETIRDGFVVKDTVVLPAGGYLVTRLIADNPGDWLAHCHVDFHQTDGMGLIIRESSPSNDHIGITRPLDFPQCSGNDYEALDLGAESARRPACDCLADPETIERASPEAGWRCSTEYLCRHEAVMKEGDLSASSHVQEQKNGHQIRGVRQRNWRKLFISIVLSIVVAAATLLLIVRVNPSDEIDPESQPWQNLFRLIFVDEWKKKMSLVHFIEVFGLALVGGALYFDVGYTTDERAFRESLAFIFWMSAFWSISSVYSSIVSYHSDKWIRKERCMLYMIASEKSTSDVRPTSSTFDVAGSSVGLIASSSLTGELGQVSVRNIFLVERVGQDRIEKLRVKIMSYHLARWFTGALLSSPFPILFSLVVDSLTQLAPDIVAVLLSALILILTQQSFDSLGRLLAEIAGKESIGRAVCFGTIVSQLLVIAGGFYRTVHPLISVICPIRYSFSGISKLFISSSDSFWCTPDRADAWRGITWCPVELSGAIADLKFRGINIIDSYEDPSVLPDIFTLIALIIFLRVSCFALTYFRAESKDNQIDLGNEKSTRALKELSDEVLNELSVSAFPGLSQSIEVSSCDIQESLSVSSNTSEDSILYEKN